MWHPVKRCRVTDCSSRAMARGLCSKHYVQERKGWKLNLRGASEMPERTRWTYEPEAENELIAAQEKIEVTQHER